MSNAVLLRAPGRVNLIGEHTDHQLGLVLPIAIDRGTTLTATPRQDGRVALKSVALGDVVSFDESTPLDAIEPEWGRYAAGALHAARESGLPWVGFDGCLGGDLPLGVGLASSAALTAVVVRAARHFARRAGHEIFPWMELHARLAAICASAEARVGVPCGIMDPFVVLEATAGHAFFLDCRSQERRHVEVDPDAIRFVVADSGVRRSLTDGRYGLRVGECNAAVDQLRTAGESVSSLRDLTPPAFERLAGVLPDDLAKRARHVVTENARVQTAAMALSRSRVEAFGHLLDQSHESLRTNFEVSCAELDELAALARGLTGVLGARMTGAGFGGCVLAAVLPDAVDALLEAFDAHGVSAFAVVPSRGALRYPPEPA